MLIIICFCSIIELLFTIPLYGKIIYEVGLMAFKLFTNEDDFIYSFQHYHKLIKFVESISGDNRWWFKEASTSAHDKGAYNVIFTSYKTPEYRNFLLSIHAEKVDGDYTFRITKQITDLA